MVTHSENTGEVVIEGRWFKDARGRVLLFRGVNLSGNAKIPAQPDMPSHVREGFFNHRDVSFVGRPFPLDEAEAHFHRLKRWGFTLLRFLVTWEAIEHAGPGKYDEEYIEYVYQVLLIAKRHGFVCFIDPHQDVWSRFSGGDGAPGWTFELAGLDIHHFVHNDAAIVHNTWTRPADSTSEDFPMMVWPSNYTKYACATMFTLFFGGNIFAPECRVGQVNIQDYLQQHYMNAIKRLAARVRHTGIVLGYDTMNEPSPGYIGTKDIRTALDAVQLRVGYFESPIQSMVLASGHATTVSIYTRNLITGAPTKSGEVPLNLVGERAILPDRQCVWQQHGVWAPKEDAAAMRGSGGAAQCALIPDYFSKHADGRPVDFYRDCWVPFAARYAAALREAHPGCAIFLEPEVNHPPPTIGDAIPGPLVYAPHWYDGMTLFQKKFAPWNVNILGLARGASLLNSGFTIGDNSIARTFAQQIATIRSEGLAHIGEWPLVIGETGAPMDLDNREAYRTNDFTMQTRALNATLSAMETNLASFTLWNYCPTNSNARGDGWNGEDFSIFSKDQMDAKQPQPDGVWQRMSATLFEWTSTVTRAHRLPLFELGAEDRGGRALPAVIRPYAMRVAGEPRHMSFDPYSGVFELRFAHTSTAPPREDCATEVFVPDYHYGRTHSFLVRVSDGTWKYDAARQLLIFVHTEMALKEHFVRILRIRADEHNGGHHHRAASPP